jgi:hypothetical protein
MGIFPSDIVLRTAIIAGLGDVRSNPWLLDFCYVFFKQDALTKAQYGEKEIANAKKWILNTDIPVFLNTRLDETKFPCISISLLSSEEEENTLADVHYDPQEESDDGWPIAASFTPVSYSVETGIIILPDSVGTGDIFPGMVVVDKTGVQHTILDTTDTTILLTPGSVADLSPCTVRPSRPSYIISLESASFKESYAIGCHVSGESVYLQYLYPVVMFILLRYRQKYLEARGLERTSVSTGEFRKDETFDNEQVYTRFINLNGHVRNYWPKDKDRKIDGIYTVPVPDNGVEWDVGNIDIDMLAGLDSIFPKKP